MRSSLTTALFAVTVTAVALLPTGTAVAAPAIGAVIQVSADPFTDTDAQHATEVEPDTFAAGNTVVAAFQVGRIFGGGSSDIGWATSTDNGTTWQNGTLPGLTVNQGGGTFSAASDASVAFDAKHNAWLIAALPIDNTGNAVGVSVDRSTNGGTTWSNPVHAVGFRRQGLRQELDRLRRHVDQRALRQLLHRGRRHVQQQRRDHGHVQRRWPDLGSAGPTVRQPDRPGRPASGAAQRNRRRALLHQRQFDPRLQFHQRRR